MIRDYNAIKKMNRGFVYINRMINLREKKAIKDSGVDITRRELEYIAVIHDYEGERQNIILHILDVSKSTWSNQLKTLQKKGLVDVRSDKKDKRAKLLYLTKTGKEAYEIHKSVRLEILKSYGAILTDEELKQLMKIGVKIIDNISGDDIVRL